MRKLLAVFVVLFSMMLLGATPVVPAPASAPASAPAGVLAVPPIAAVVGLGASLTAAVTVPAPVAAPAAETTVPVVLPTVPPAVVPDPQVPDYDMIGLVKQLAVAFKSGDWMLVVALAIMLLVGGMKLLWPFWKDKTGLKPYLPWIALGMGLAAVLATGLAAHLAIGPLIGSLIASAVVLGSAAIGIQDGLKKFKESRLWQWLSSKLGVSSTARAEKLAKDAAVVLSRAGKSLSLSPDGKVLLDGKPFGIQ